MCDRAPNVLCRFPVCITKPGFYCLDKNVKGNCTDFAIKIKGSNITLDLGGNLINTNRGFHIQCSKNVTIQNGRFECLDSTNQEFSSVVENSCAITLSDLTFEGCANALLINDNNNLTLLDLKFKDCYNGLVGEGLHQNMKINGISFINNNAPTGDENFYAMSLNSRCDNCEIDNIDSVNGQLYVFQGSNGSDNNWNILMQQFSPFSLPAPLQIGGPRIPRDLTFVQGRIVVPPEFKFGCVNSQMNGFKVRVEVEDPDTITFYLGIFALYCNNCTFDRAKASGNTAVGFVATAHMALSYCHGCHIRNSETVGAANIGIHVCDVLALDPPEPCFNATVIGCSASESRWGISGFKTVNPIYRDCNSNGNLEGGFYFTGSVSATLFGCVVSGNPIGVITSTLPDGPALGTYVTKSTFNNNILNSQEQLGGGIVTFCDNCLQEGPPLLAKPDMITRDDKFIQDNQPIVQSSVDEQNVFPILEAFRKMYALRQTKLAQKTGKQ